MCRRIYNDEEGTYLNLGADKILLVSACGGETVSEHGLIFPTDPTMMQLPVPTGEADVVKVLSGLLDLDEQQTLLALAYFMTYFQPDGGFPPLIVTGPPKSGKSRLAASIRQMIDPAHAPLLSCPSKPGDFNALVANNSVLAFDDVTNVPQACRDAIMALAQGTGRFDRRSGTTSKSKIPTILVCEDLSNVGELARDAIVIRLQSRGIGKMKSKNTLDREFSAIHAQALGALADLAANAKASDDKVELNAVFNDGALELWLLCVDKALGANGKLMDAYRQNGRTVLSDIVAESPVLSAFMGMLRTKGSVTATATDMQILVEPFLAGPKGSCWPKSPKDFATLLRKAGL